MRTSRIVLVVVGVLAGLLGMGLLVGGGALVWAHTTQRDADGFYTTEPERFESATSVITSTEIDLGAERAWHWGVAGRDWATAQVQARSTGPDVFVGIAPEDAVEEYLDGVAHDEVTDVSYDPFDVSYQRTDGTGVPAPPSDQDFWVAQGLGSDVDVRWDVEPGRWAVVVMNADGSPGVAVDAAAGVRTGLLLPIGIALVVGAVVVLATAVALLVLGSRDRGAAAAAPGEGTAEAGPSAAAAPARPPTIPAGAYPARLAGHLQADLSRWLWLVKWFLAIPHFVVLTFLWMAFALLTLAAGVAILFTGRYPRGVFDFNVGVMRWTWRVTFYALTLGTDRYPPFSLDPDPTYPATFDVAYPDQLSRGLVLVKWWLLALPHYLIISVFGGGLTWWTWSWAASDEGVPILGGGLISLLVVVAAVILAVTARYPRPLFDFVMGMQRWIYRVMAYAALMRDEYPPFRLDTGGAEPDGHPAGPTPPAPDRSGDLIGV
jgi:hypothetical protein